MQNIILLFAVFLSYQASAAGGFRATKLRNLQLVDILNFAQVIELNKLKGMNGAEFRYRLYEVPVQGNCIPETHMVCSHHYYLAMSELDDSPKKVVWDLGLHGQLSHFYLGKETPQTSKRGGDTIYFTSWRIPRALSKRKTRQSQKNTLYGGSFSLSSLSISSVPKKK